MLHSLGEEIQILKFCLYRKRLKNGYLIDKEIILKKKKLVQSLEVFFEAVGAFCFDFDVSTNRQDAKTEMHLLDLVACFHNYSQSTSMTRTTCFHETLPMCGISIS